MADQQSATSSGKRRLKIGMIGIGVGANMVLPAVTSSDEFELVAGADINPRVMEVFRQRYPNAHAYDSAEKLIADPDVEVVWNATPNKYHSPYVVLAAEHGKHIIAEKPFAISLAEAEKMVDAVEKNGVKMVAGHTLGFSPPVQAMRRIIRSGDLGKLCAINTYAYTDWMLQPRQADEVDVSQGGGMVFRQSPHQIDTVRVLGGGMLRSVRGTVGQWSTVRPCPGYYTAYLEFEDGTPAIVVYNGYGYFVGAELVPWGNELGIFGKYGPKERSAVRKGLRAGTLDENQMKDMQRIGGKDEGDAHEHSHTGRKPWTPLHIGVLVVSCERGDIRQSPYGIYVHSDEGLQDLPVEASSSMGKDELHELYEAVVNGKPVYHDGAWGMATLEVTLAIMQSAQERKEVRLSHQVPIREDVGSAV